MSRFFYILGIKLLFLDRDDIIIPKNNNIYLKYLTLKGRFVPELIFNTEIMIFEN